MQADIKDFLTGRGIEWEEVDDLAKVAGDVDVLYQTRIQKERFQVSFLGLLCLSFRCRLEARSTGKQHQQNDNLHPQKILAVSSLQQQKDP